jgi:Putative zinc-finger
LSRDRKAKVAQDEHREIDLLLPWYVNGSLDEPERERVRLHVQECHLCQQEVQLVSLIQTEVVGERQGEPEPAPGGLEQVLTKIKSQQ